MQLLARNYGTSVLVHECLKPFYTLNKEQPNIACFFSDRRLADHFGGKLHLGYMQIREKLAELQVK